MTPSEFKACIEVLSEQPADFVVRALVHAADALQQTPYKEGGALITEALYRIQNQAKPRPAFGPTLKLQPQEHL